MKHWTMVSASLLIGVGSASIALQAPQPTQAKRQTVLADGGTGHLMLCSAPAGLLQPPGGGDPGGPGGRGGGGRGGRGGGPGRGGPGRGGHASMSL